MHRLPFFPQHSNSLLVLCPSAIPPSWIFLESHVDFRSLRLVPLRSHVLPDIVGELAVNIASHRLAPPRQLSPVHYTRLRVNKKGLPVQEKASTATYSPKHLPPAFRHSYHNMRLRRAARVILVGAPGVGKGTQSERLLHRFPQLQCISSGDLLRNNVKNRTALGESSSTAHITPPSLDR